jgi:hypothetical protein
MSFIINKKEIEETLFGLDTESIITDYQFEHFCKWWNSMEAFDDYANNPKDWKRDKAIKVWFSLYGDRDDLETIQWTPFELYAETHPKLKNNKK